MVSVFAVIILGAAPFFTQVYLGASESPPVSPPPSKVRASQYTAQRQSNIANEEQYTYFLTSLLDTTVEDVRQDDFGRMLGGDPNEEDQSWAF